MGYILSVGLRLGWLGLILLVLPAQAQSISKALADSVRQVLPGTKLDTTRVHLLLQLGAYQVYKPGEFPVDMDSARTYAKQAQRLSNQLGYYPGEGKSLNLLGTISREAKEFPQAIAFQVAALHLYKRHQDIRGIVSSYLLLAHARREKGDPEQARKEVHTAIRLATRNNYPYQAGEGYIELGNTYANWGEELKEKINYYQQALPWFAQAGSTKKQADVHKDLGDLYGLAGNSAQALIELRKALALYRSIQYPALQGVYDLLGDVSNELGDYKEAMRYGLLAVKTAEALKDSTLQMCTIYNHVGQTYYYLKQNQKALSYWKKSLHIAQKYKAQSSIIILIVNIADLFTARLNQPKEALNLTLGIAQKYPPQNISDSISLTHTLLYAYTRLKQYSSAQRYCDQLLALADESGISDFNQGVIYFGAIRFFVASKQHNQARKYLAEYELYSRKNRSLRGVSQVQFYWFKLDSIQGNYISAIKHYQRYKLLEDSLFDKTKSRQIANLEVLHETEQKEKNIKLKQKRINLLTRQSQLQNQKMKQDQLIRNVIIGGAILLLLLLALIYNRYLLKQRSNQLLQAQQKELEAQQREINHKNAHLSELLTQKDTLLEEKDTLLTEKEWLLKEIHHRVKNNLQVVMSLLNSPPTTLEDQAALSAIQESQHRVQAMAFIHQKLYQSESVARIPMADYISEVVAYLHESYHLPQPIRLQLEVEPIELDVTQAVPLGLIINEAITNALKYAFPQGRSGTVNLSLHRLEETTYELSIADDGVGLPEGYQPGRSRSLGMKLLHGFSRQLGGKLTISSVPGLSISLVFAEEQLRSISTRVAYA
jgi:two-component sensor histidine kinase